MRDVNATMRIIVTGLVALALWISGAGIAAAHTALAGSDPAKDADLTSPPAVITLTFTEDINPTFASVVISSADGRSWASGDPQVDGPRVSAGVQPDLPPTGVYTVGYRVVSADGHPVSGSYTFTIVGVPGQPPPASTSVAAAPTTASAPPQSVSPEGSDTKPSILTAAVAGLALGGAIVFWQSRRRRQRNAVVDETRPADATNPGEETAAR